MNTLEIQTFLTIVEYGSISLAAQHLSVSQSTVSHRLNSLEEKIGNPLVLRGQGIKKIQLTPSGREFLFYANRFDSFVKDFEYWKDISAKAILRVAGPLSINAHTLKHFYRDFAYAEHPISLQVTVHWNHTIYRMLENYELDVGIVSRPMFSTNLVTTPLFLEPMVMISNPAYSNYGEVVDANTLEQKDEIHMDWGSNFNMWHNQLWAGTKHPMITLDSPMLIEFLLEKKDAWSVVPKSVAANLYTNTTKMSHLSPSIGSRTIYIITQREQTSYAEEAVKLFQTELWDYVHKSNIILPLKNTDYNPSEDEFAPLF